jgi:hypothetical protein
MVPKKFASVGHFQALESRNLHGNQDLLADLGPQK